MRKVEKRNAMRILATMLLLAVHTASAQEKITYPSKDEITQFATQLNRIAVVYKSAIQESEEMGVDVSKDQEVFDVLSNVTLTVRDHPDKYTPTGAVLVSQLLSRMMINMTSSCLKIASDVMTKQMGNKITIDELNRKTGALQHISTDMLSIQNVSEISDDLTLRAVSSLESSPTNKTK